MRHFQVIPFFYLLFATSFALAQTSPPPRFAKNNAFLEWRGVTGHYSINYERLLWRVWKNRVVVGCGLGFSNYSDEISRWRSFPFRTSLSVGMHQVHGEFGLDYVLVTETYKSPKLAPISEGFAFFRMGLRYQPKKRGLFFRAYLFPVSVTAKNAPFLYHIGQSYFQLRRQQRDFWWGGIGVGYSFPWLQK